jgi:aquaporin Z
MPLSKRLLAEFIGTLWLVLGGCGSAVLAATFTSPGVTAGDNALFPLGLGFVGVSLAFGLTVLTMAYAIGHISGCHLNPAVSFGLWSAGRFPGGELLPYIVAQVLGAIAAAGILYIIASGQPNFVLGGSNPLATNGFGAHSPGGYNLAAAFLTEAIMTFFFLTIILGATDRRAPAGLAPVAIGLGLTLIHLISIPVTNTSVNPARSTGPALFAGAELFSQLWLFWVAPILGALLAGWLYSAVFEEPQAATRVESEYANR